MPCSPTGVLACREQGSGALPTQGTRHGPSGAPVARRAFLCLCVRRPCRADRPMYAMYALPCGPALPGLAGQGSPPCLACGLARQPHVCLDPLLPARCVRGAGTVFRPLFVVLRLPFPCGPRSRTLPLTSPFCPPPRLAPCPPSSTRAHPSPPQPRPTTRPGPPPCPTCRPRPLPPHTSTTCLPPRRSRSRSRSRPHRRRSRSTPHRSRNRSRSRRRSRSRSTSHARVAPPPCSARLSPRAPNHMTHRPLAPPPVKRPHLPTARQHAAAPACCLA